MSVQHEFLLILKSSTIGDGEPDLGEKLMKSFLTQLVELGEIPSKIICLSSGIFLTTEGSYVFDILKEFEKQGTEILSCGTCLEYYDRKEKLIIGKPTNMTDTVRAMLSFSKVVTP